MDATTTRASTVIRSIPTSEIRTQASITIPLSSTLSRTSIKLDPPETLSTAIQGLLHENRSLYLARLARTAGLLRRAWDPGGAPGKWLRRATGSGAGAVRLGSNLHQLRPMASALSTE